MIAITTGDGIRHVLESEAAIAAYNSSFNTARVLKAACTEGHWKTHTPAQQPPEIPPPDWKTFRLALLKSKTFRLWSELLPSSWREDLKLAAVAANAEALQDIYNYCKSISLPGLASTSEWQQLADKSNIPVTF